MTVSQNQQSVVLTVGSNIVSGGSYTPPYRIINNSAKATVWISDNPGMAPGQGTVLYPGTSIGWSRDGSLYLILGDDTLSTDTGEAEIILSYDINDWQPNPVAIAAAALNRQQFFPAVISSDANSDSGTIDGSLFSSVVINFAWAFLAVGNYPLSLQVVFFPTKTDSDNFTNQLWSDYWSWDRLASGTAPMGVTIPLRSPYFRIRHSMTAFGGNRVEIRYALSTNYVEKPRYEILTNDWPNLSNQGLLLVIGGAVAIGAATAFHPLAIPYGGDVDITVRVAAAAAPNGNVRIGWAGTEYDIQNLTAAYSGIPNNAGIRFRTSLPTHLTTIRLVNNNVGAVAWTSYIITVTAADTSRG